jgi:hypothetical protein
MKKYSLFVAAIFIIFCLSAPVFAQTTVFSDDFSANTDTVYTTGGTIGASSFSVTRSGDDFGARRNTSPAQLELTNDASGATNANGWVFASTPTGTFASPYDATLDANPGLVTWTFNVRQIRPDPAGFGSNSYGVAFVLGSTSTNIAATGDGYAVVLGNTLTTDPVRLVKFTGGLQSLGTTAPPTTNDLIVSNTTGLTDFGNEYLSVRVTYNPANNQWELFLRNDGTTGFADPTTGTLTSQGTAADSTYTGIALTALGGYWQGSTGAAQTAFFDNITVTVAQAPTAAGVSVSGQVRAGKTPISGATVMITGGDLTEPLFARTNSFGNYAFEGLLAGQIYVVNVTSKRYYFPQSSIVLNVEDNVAGADFEAEER